MHWIVNWYYCTKSRSCWLHWSALHIIIISRIRWLLLTLQTQSIHRLCEISWYLKVLPQSSLQSYISQTWTIECLSRLNYSYSRPRKCILLFSDEDKILYALYYYYSFDAIMATLNKCQPIPYPQNRWRTTFTFSVHNFSIIYIFFLHNLQTTPLVLTCDQASPFGQYRKTKLFTGNHMIRLLKEHYIINFAWKGVAGVVSTLCNVKNRV